MFKAVGGTYFENRAAVLSHTGRVKLSFSFFFLCTASRELSPSLCRVPMASSSPGTLFSSSQVAGKEFGNSLESHQQRARTLPEPAAVISSVWRTCWVGEGQKAICGQRAAELSSPCLCRDRRERTFQNGLSFLSPVPQSFWSISCTLAVEGTPDWLWRCCFSCRSSLKK